MAGHSSGLTVLTGWSGKPPRWRLLDISHGPLREDIGAKAHGLTLVPTNWRPPSVSISHSLLEELPASPSKRQSILTSVARRVLRELQNATAIIVRSSAQAETIDRRGEFDSLQSPATSSDLARNIEQLYTSARRALKASETFSILVQPYLSSDAKGHLTNEYRHAQRAVDFLYEAEEIQLQNLELQAFKTYRFRLSRPVKPVKTTTRLRMKTPEREFFKTLQTVARWLAGGNRRAHVEWVLSRKTLWIVQCDWDQEIEDHDPLSQWQDAPVPARHPALKVFRAFKDGEDYDRWRKTRSHGVVSAAGLYVPPIFFMDNPDTIRDLQSGLVPPNLEDDLNLLLRGGLVLRVDVDSSLKDWVNLPAKGPVLSIEDAKQFVLSAMAEAGKRNASEKSLALVAHHFVRARASAWASSSGVDNPVKIDANWGLPDGLQAFPYDS